MPINSSGCAPSLRRVAHSPHCPPRAAWATSGRMHKGVRRMSRLGIQLTLPVAAAVASALLGGLAAAQAPRTDTAAIYLYQGADRDQRLVEAAKKEGTLTFYTSMQTPESGPLSQAFEKKYGIKVQLWPATSEQVVQRAITEARGW